MKIMYRVVGTGYDMCAHQPCVCRIAKNMHTDKSAALTAAKEAAISDFEHLMKQFGEDAPAYLHMQVNGRQHDDLIEAATIKYAVDKGDVLTYSEFFVCTVEQHQNINRYSYRDFTIEYDTNEKWYYATYAHENRCRAWSARSLEACLDIVDEICNSMCA